MKICTKCLQYKQNGDFGLYRNTKCKLVRLSRCKDCIKSYHQIRNEKIKKMLQGIREEIRRNKKVIPDKFCIVCNKKMKEWKIKFCSDNCQRKLYFKNKVL